MSKTKNIYKKNSVAGFFDSPCIVTILKDKNQFSK